MGIRRLLALLLLPILLAPAGGAESEVAANDALAAQLARGEALYAFHCTTCHGVSGAGFAEARAAFPADHYDCSRCHMPLNPAVMSPRQIADSQTVFSLGNAPALRDAAALARFGTAHGLWAYTQATMPRWAPGYVGDPERYVDIVAYVLHLAGLGPREPLTLANLATVDLSE
jgi:mono/diheme cytochrome c family protein